MACTDLDKAAPAAGDDRHLHEECGVFGIYSNVTADVASLAYYALYALQHRGQESAGIVVNDDGLFRSWRDVGLVSDVFPKERLRSLGHGNIAVDHVRYGTTGSDNKRNVQPILVNHYKGRMALAHNGNLTNSQELRLQLESQGSIFHTTTDSEVIAYIIVQERLKHGSIEEAVSAAMDRLVGAYSLVISSPSKLIAVRDPHGFRPLCMGRLKDGSVVFASESCGLDAVGASFERDILPGEIVVADKNGVKSDRSHCGIAPRRLCVFEFIYFARPDSVIDGSSELTKEDVELVKCAERAPHGIVILSKHDLGTVAAVPETPLPVVEISSVTGEGLQELAGTVRRLFPMPAAPAGEILTNARQLDAVSRALESMKAAENAMETGCTPDIVLTETETAMAALGELSGRTVREEVTNRIFERFCVGK